MRKILLILLISVVLILIINTVIYKEVPQTIRVAQRTEIQHYNSVIKSLSIDDTNYNDLRVFDSVLIGNKILMLGENTHHDGQTFEAKSRLIKYLHENKGYHVVLYEAGQFDAWMMNKAMNEHGTIKVSDDSIGGIGLFHFWWANQETQPIIHYYLKTKSTSTPIELGGFDIQFSGSLMEGRRSQLLKKFFDRHGINLKHYPLFNQYSKDLHLLLYKAFVDKRLDAKQRGQLLDEIKGLEQAVCKLDPSEENIMYAKYLHDIGNNYYKSWRYESGSMLSMNFRDSLMAKNLIYQIDSVYAGQKVIIWCANVHTFASRYSIDYLPLGAYIKKKYGKSSYMLNFSSYGRYSSEDKVVDKPGKLAVENVFYDTKSPYFFIDLRNLPVNSFLKHDFVSTINQGIDQKRVWSDFIDGIFYIDINKNPTYLEK